MNLTISPKKLRGTVTAIPSKSQAHRLLICAAFADAPTKLCCPQTNQDIEATAACLRDLGAKIIRTEVGYDITPLTALPSQAVLNCNESGSTLRFMLPIVGALGVDTTFQMAGRLPKRPLSPLWEEMERMGCRLSRPSDNTIRCCGRLMPGEYVIDGGVSSQFITGLLFAMALITGNSKLTVTGKTESKPYILMTQCALITFGVNAENYTISGCMPFKAPGDLVVEGDWSNGAFFLAAGALGSDVTVEGLDPLSLQGDRAITNILVQLEDNVTIDAADIPDLVPILAVVAGAKQGATFLNIDRLRLKESDRVASVANMIQSFGGNVQIEKDQFTVFPGKYHSCTIDSVGDHRIAMSAAIGATVADGPVTILGAECVAKSYSTFWEEYKRLGGNYEQYIR